MKSFDDGLVHKTVAELFDMVKSKQAEVDELQKRIDKAVEHIEDYYGVVGLSLIVDILKGDQS